ncbi:hypothetical protein LZ30DRAFT_538808, partial [Colletotrichum cereale]
LAFLNSTVVVTLLPTILEKLKFGSTYAWAGKIFFLSRKVFIINRPYYPPLSTYVQRRR